MNILPYYILHTFVNSIKKLFRTWVAVVIGLILLFAIIGGTVGGIIGSVVDKSDEPSSSYSEETETNNEVKDFDQRDNKDLTCNIIEMVIGGVALLVVLYNVYNGDKSGASIFTMPDVNFLFSSPIKPQSILMFRTILQMGVALVSSIYLLFQIPNLTINAGLGIYSCLSLFLAWIIILFVGKLCAVFTYTISATHLNLRKYIRPFVIAVVVIIAAVYFGYIYTTGKGFYESAVSLFASPKGRFIPIFGWLRAMVLGIITKQYAYSFINFILLALSCALLVYFIWKIKADFYEDALTQASIKEDTLTNTKEGRNTKRKKDRKENIERNGEIGGFGASVFLNKTIYNRKRFSKFSIFSGTSSTYILIVIAVCVFCLKLVETKSIIPVGFAMLIVIYFRNLGNPIASETTHNFIYLVPESPYKKIFYTLIGGTYETTMDLIPAFIISAILLENFSQTLLWLILWISLDLFCSSVGIFIEIIMPAAIVPTIKSMLSMMLRMIAIIPGLIILVCGAAFSHMILMIIITVVINLSLSALLYAVTPGFLHLGKK